MVESYHPRTGIDMRTRLVEAYVARTAYAQKLKIQPAVRLYLHIVVGAILFQFVQRHVSVRNIDILRQYVHMIEQMFMHERPIALGIVTGYAVIFVQIESHYVCKRKAIFLVHTDKLGINTYRRTAGSQTQHSRLSFRVLVADYRSYLFCYRYGRYGGVLEYFSVQFLETHVFPPSYFFMGYHLFFLLYVFLFGTLQF